MLRVRSVKPLLGGLMGLGALAAVPSIAADYDAYRGINSIAQVGPRPYFLLDQLVDGELKDKLSACPTDVFRKTKFSIGHRGAGLQFPEHTLESYLAAARQGAGIIECDVTFTKDGELVCRHSQCDLHTTTDIVTHPTLNAQCEQPFQPATYDADGNKLTDATARCCTSDITLAEFRTLKGKMDGANADATTAQEYLQGTPGFRTDLYAGPGSGTLMTHAESVELFKTLGVGVTPELKAPSVTMPFDTNGDGAPDFTHDDYRQKLIDELRAGGIRPRDAWVQSFERDDIDYWVANAPDFAAQAVYLIAADTPAQLESFLAELPTYKAAGINYVAPATWALVDASGTDIVPSDYATTAKAERLKIITWTLERSGILADGDGEYYYQSINDVLADRQNEGVALELLDVLARDVGIEGIFSDWPATVTFYANCMGL
ncbi:MAG: glycerophosphodiester phosphodiesterase [Thiohalocapsa sp.]|jgi:glycerophosphoryl diester phosphodiesterase|uniref:glycerophosphodiester phosphodiesterase family protein n=1 Tax=Thiohalocapsa sp. TaxID=2497641 RepID=UPI0025CC15D0|nr:glycerophosphodiester phosphodiesterase family protein [Thiohalocapsa sp.]MCG6942931.1 glycerophosphodiester phosphodiesterase [Thiohalocapsa sp.]